MSKGLRVVAALVLVVASFFGQQILELAKAWNNNKPSVDVVEPDLTYKDVVKDIVSVDIKAKDADQMSDFFAELAEVVSTDPGFISSTGHFREFNMTAGGLNFAGLDLKGKYPSLGKHIDKPIVSSIGLEDVTLSEEKRSELVKCLRAVAWAVHQ